MEMESKPYKKRQDKKFCPKNLSTKSHNEDQSGMDRSTCNARILVATSKILLLGPVKNRALSESIIGRTIMETSLDLLWGQSICEGGGNVTNINTPIVIKSNNNNNNK